MAFRRRNSSQSYATIPKPIQALFAALALNLCGCSLNDAYLKAERARISTFLSEHGATDRPFVLTNREEVKAKGLKVVTSELGLPDDQAHFMENRIMKDPVTFAVAVTRTFDNPEGHTTRTDIVCAIGASDREPLRLIGELTLIPEDSLDISPNILPLLAQALNTHEAMHCAAKHQYYSGHINSTRNEIEGDRAGLEYLKKLHQTEAASYFKSLRMVQNFHWAAQKPDGEDEHYMGLFLMDESLESTEENIRTYQNNLRDITKKALSLIVGVYGTPYKDLIPSVGETQETAIGRKPLEDYPALFPAAIYALTKTGQLPGNQEKIARYYLEAIHQIAPSTLDPSVQATLVQSSNRKRPAFIP